VPFVVKFGVALKFREVTSQVKFGMALEVYPVEAKFGLALEVYPVEAKFEMALEVLHVEVKFGVALEGFSVVEEVEEGVEPTFQSP